MKRQNNKRKKEEKPPPLGFGSAGRKPPLPFLGLSPPGLAGHPHYSLSPLPPVTPPTPPQTPPKISPPLPDLDRDRGRRPSPPPGSPVAGALSAGLLSLAGLLHSVAHPRRPPQPPPSSLPRPYASLPVSSSPPFPLCRRRRPHPVAAPDGVRRAPSPRLDASRLVNRPHGRPPSLPPPPPCRLRHGLARPGRSPLALASPLHAGLRVVLVADARGRPPPLPAGLTRLCPASSAHGARPRDAPVSPRSALCAVAAAGEPAPRPRRALLSPAPPWWP